jgi:RNA polymerase sigma factor (sigma-70 family)
MNISSKPVVKSEALSEDAYIYWHRLVEPRLRAAFVAELGPELGRDATAEAFELHSALAELSTRQRQVVVLCVGYGLTHAQVAALLGISRSSVQNHVERGLRHLRTEIKP